MTFPIFLPSNSFHIPPINGLFFLIIIVIHTHVYTHMFTCMYTEFTESIGLAHMYMFLGLLNTFLCVCVVVDVYTLWLAQRSEVTGQRSAWESHFSYNAGHEHWIRLLDLKASVLTC